VSLTPWRVTGLIVLAAVLVAIAVLDATEPSKTPAQAACETAESSETQGLVNQAEHGYLAILAKDPSNDCAKKGTLRVGARWCARAALLKKGGATLEAVKVYTAALDEQPYDTPLECAVIGLRGLGGAGSAAECHGAVNAQCVDLVVNVKRRQRQEQRQRHEWSKWPDRRKWPQRPERTKRTQRSQRPDGADYGPCGATGCS
jgi:hypothetical protein